MDTLKNLLQNNILTAVDDYFRHTYSTEVRDDISDSFVNRLAEDVVQSKRELRELFRQSNGWNENLQAIVINGTKTHNPNHIRIHNLANTILAPAKWNADFSKIDLIDRAISFFSRSNNPPDSYIDAINELAPNAYAPRKKRSRIFKSLCDALGVTDYSAGSDFQKLFAQFADELSTRKIDFKLFVSINSAHFLTMSNPKCDNRGDMLTSCHSFNSTGYEYNCGCTGYARDDCFESDCDCCNDCGAAFDREDNEVRVCDDCLRDNYESCDVCGNYFHEDALTHAVNSHGDEVWICESCRANHYETCDKCGKVYHESLMRDGMCPTCRARVEEESE